MPADGSHDPASFAHDSFRSADLGRALWIPVDHCVARPGAILVCHAGADAILAHQRAPSPAHLPLAGGFQPKPDNSPERTVSPVLVLGWIPLGQDHK